LSFLTILGVAAGLAMDAFAVSIASGLVIFRLQIRHILYIASMFALFQAVMPVIGWLAGIGMQGYLMSVSRWIAFGLLAGIGIKMIVESYTLKEKTPDDPTKPTLILILAVATSLDALAAGVSFGLLKLAIIRPVIIIGCVTFIFCFSGVLIGHHFGHLFEQKIEIAGGLILIGIGIKILLSGGV